MGRSFVADGKTFPTSWNFQGMADEPIRAFETFSVRKFWDARIRGNGGSSANPCGFAIARKLLSPEAWCSIGIFRGSHRLHL
jgi:hypothetical protein